jgi:hypothetical protein
MIAAVATVVASLGDNIRWHRGYYDSALCLAAVDLLKAAEYM